MERKNREVTAELAAAAVGAAVGLMIVRTIEHARGAAVRVLAEGAGVVRQLLDDEGVVVEEVKEDPTAPIRPPLR